jgi:protein-S-isoprenylcysteine O-methyltransferase Ste14
VIASGPRWLAPPWTLVGAGVALHSWATSASRRAGTTADLESRPTALGCVGSYRWSRNPMYLAGVPILVGVVLLLGSIAPVSILFLYCARAGR